MMSATSMNLVALGIAAIVNRPSVTWTPTDTEGHFTVRVAPNASFHAYRDGEGYRVVMGTGPHRWFWSRAEVERACMDYFAQRQIELADDDEGEPLYRPCPFQSSREERMR